jgi:Mg-chelatase subunit ChlD
MGLRVSAVALADLVYGETSIARDRHCDCRTLRSHGTLAEALDTQRGVLVAGFGLVVSAGCRGRPQTLGPPQAQQHSGRAVMLAVDLSGSMQTPDMVLAVGK